MCTVGGRPSSTTREADCHSVEDWDSSSWTGEIRLSCREARCNTLGFCLPWRDRASGATCKVAGYSFPPLSGESGVPTL
jgi:hypothetical protein